MNDETYQGPNLRASQGWHVGKNISAGHVLTTITIIIAGFWFIAGQDKRIAENAKDVQHVSSLIEQNSNAIKQQESRTNRSLDAINSKLDKLTDLLLSKK
jgi:hypothetical protein